VKAHAHRLFLVVPLLLIAMMVLSVLWVPTYSNPAKGEFTRARSFVEASIGDARFLNPILNADSASSRIVGLVFDGLLTYDRELELIPHVASDYKVYEYVYINLPNSMDALAVADQLKIAFNQGKAPGLGSHVVSIEAQSDVRESRTFSIEQQADVEL
jgi:ABC-type transport system substrate-binding protein